MTALALEPATIGLPFVRTLLIVRSHRVIKRTGEGKPLTRYYLSSRPPDSHAPAQWLGLIRGHWAGVENRNHWRKDAVWLEDRTRSRNANLVGNLALLRNALLKIYTDHLEHYNSLAAFSENLRADPSAAFWLITRPLRI